jgi:acetate kinase
MIKQKTQKILIFNMGSTSLKISGYNIIDQSDNQTPFQKFTQSQKEYQTLQEIPTILDDLKTINPTLFQNCDYFLHRIVFGGDKFLDPVVINSTTLIELEQISTLAPLHNPPALEVIKFLQIQFPQIPQIACFDSAFHSTIPTQNRLYAIPKEFIKKGIIKYGYHGIAHQSLLESYANNNQKSLENCNILTLQLGGGCSICAIKQGKSINTSMGFSPEEGLIMNTRVGNIGAGAIMQIISQTSYNPLEMLNILNKQSGLLALGGEEFKGDPRLLVQAYNSNTQAKLAIDIFIDKIVEYIGSYWLLHKGFEAIVFGGGIGQGSSLIRELVCNKLKILGIKIDQKSNQSLDDNPQNYQIISTGSSIAQVCVAKTEEEILMLKVVAGLLQQIDGDYF